jgi:hypothetical protein
MTLQGKVSNGVVVLEGGTTLPDGTLVDVIPRGNAVTSATRATDDVAEAALPVSKEQREALLSLIGIWRTNNPPTEEEVERIIDEARMKKYG